MRISRFLAGLCGLVITLSVISTSPAQAAPRGTPPPTSLAARQKAVHDTSTPAPCAAPAKSRTGVEYAHCMARVATNADHKIVPDATAPRTDALSPADIQAAYQLPDGGDGALVAIVDAMGDSSAESDLATFRSQYGLPPCTTANGCFQKVDQNGGTDYPPDDIGWALETSLDLDAVSAACPRCHILLVEGTTSLPDNLAQAVDTAVRLGAVAVSNSYGLDGELARQTTLDQHYDHPGVAITVSAGDMGGVVNWPASNPTVTSVGGTTLRKNTANPRGWDETPWVDGGSGCSAFEPMPSFQRAIDTACPENRATADVSAVGDPFTGLSTFDSLGFTGWLRVGGTSLSAPLVAAMYALAGKPAAGTYPVNYLYNAPDRAGVLNDITTGSNADCGNQLCTAGPGWDGPTGLGTPHGVAAFTLGQHGDFTGQVTGGSGQPLAGASLVATDTETGFTYLATTDGKGKYDIPIRPGRTYDLTASMFGFAAKTSTGLQVEPGVATTVDFALASVPSEPVTGTVTDGSGHGYPLYAKITIDGYPNGAVFTDPHTGAYHVDLPQNQTFRFHIGPVAQPGYQRLITDVGVGDSPVQHDLTLKADGATCTAPGYAFTNRGLIEPFEEWGSAPQHGWTEIDNNGSGFTWDFDDPLPLGNRTGASGGFAAVESLLDFTAAQDTTLVSPAVDLTGVPEPEVGLNTDYEGIDGQTGDIELSLDGGSTWTVIWHQTTDTVTGRVDIPVPQAAGHADVRVRFHFSALFGNWWQIDDVLVGSRSCDPTTGGLVEGTVTDRNTGMGVNGATVTGAGGTGTSMSTPEDAALSDGFYWLFAPTAGSGQVTAQQGNYQKESAPVDVVADATTRADLSLAAGHLTTTPGEVSVTEEIGAATHRSVTYTNDGTAPLDVQLGERDSGLTPLARTQGAPTQLIRGNFRPGRITESDPNGVSALLDAGTDNAAGSAWSPLADYPIPIIDNVVGYYNGTIYSADGGNRETPVTAKGYSYTPSRGAWTPIADAPVALEAPAGTFVNGRLYMVGGWDETGSMTSGAYAYDPSTDSWSQVADLPEKVTGAAHAVLDGRLYILGGCADASCVTSSKAVYSFDPVAGTWTRHADNPGGGAFQACAGIGGRIVCAGGFASESLLTTTYSYDPVQDSWTRMADMPYDNYGMAYSGSNGMLQIAGGFTNHGFDVTNRAAQYDPASDTWSALPNANVASARGGSTCGLYKIGGVNGTYLPASETLPGLDNCGDRPDVPWLSASSSTFTLDPGASVTVDVTVDSQAIAQPGTYTAALTASTDSPYHYPALQVTMQVTAPKSWGKVAGTVTDAATGKPLAGATVTICAGFTKKGGCGQATFTIRTGADGSYQWWLDKAANPVGVTASRDGFAAQFRIVRIHAGQTLPADFALVRATG